MMIIQEYRDKSYMLILAIVCVLAFNTPVFSYNWDWDQGHQIIDSDEGDTPYGNEDYAGNENGAYTPHECCGYCTVCPVFANTGQMQKTYTDLVVPGIGPQLKIARTYNSQDWTNSLFGNGWTFNFGRRLIITRGKDGDKRIGVLLEQGEKSIYREHPDGSLERLTDYGARYTLIKNGDGSYTMAYLSGTRYELRDDGKISKVVDSNENEMVFFYNSVGCLSRIENASGNYVDFQLGPNGKIQSVTDNLGRSIRYGYDENGNLTSFTNPMDYSEQYLYNDENLLVQCIDARGNVAESVTYDDFRPRRVSTFTENDELYSLEYFDGRTEKTDSEGNKWLYYFNDIGIIEKIVDPLGAEKKQAPNLATAYTMDWQEDGNGNITQFTYDSFGNRTSRTDPLGNKWTYTYISGTNWRETATDPYGTVTKYDYDEYGNLIKLTRDFGGSLETSAIYDYDSAGKLVAVTDSLGNCTRFDYDEHGKLIKLTDSQGNATTYTHDDRGNRKTRTDALGHSTIYEYDLLDRLLSITDALNNKSTFEYDANGNIVAITDANQNRTIYEYDAYDRLERVVDAREEGFTTTYTYKNDNLASIQDANGNVTSYDYDPLDRLIKTAYPDGTTEIYTYDNAGNLDNKITRKKEMIDYTYDQLNRLTEKVYPDGSLVSYEYDKIGRLQVATNNTGPVNYEYDALNRLTQENQNGRIVRYDYDLAGNRTKLTYPDGTFIGYRHDALNRLDLINDAGGGMIADYDYDPLGRRSRLTLGNGTEAAYVYDQANRLVRLTNRVVSDNSIISDFGYTHDGVGNRVTMTTTKGTHSYSYDNTYQLTHVDYPEGFPFPDTTYTLDGLGNRTLVEDGGSVPYASNNMNQYEKVGGVAYEYDDNGNLTNDGENTFIYDYDNRLIRVDSPSGTVTYDYDALGRRVSRADSSGHETFVYAHDQIIAVYDGDGNLKRKFVFGSRIDEPIIIEIQGNQYYYHFDGLGSVKEISDSEGGVKERYEYDVYGKPVIKNSSGEALSKSNIGNSYFFSGREYDDDIDLFYYRARYYSAALGRFLQIDPIRFFGGMNLYRYCLNNPINYVDPEGLFVGTAITRLLNVIVATERTAQEVALASQLTDIFIGAGLQFSDIPDTGVEDIDKALKTMEVVGAVQTGSMAVSMAGAGVAGSSAAVGLSIPLAGLAGTEAGFLLNDLYEEISGQMLGEDIYDWLHPNWRRGLCE